MVGYRVTNMVTAKIRDIDKAGSIIDVVAEAGGDLTRIDSIDFSVDDPSAYYEEARQEAMAEAKDKAEQLAELADVTLGKPTYISEGIQVPPIIRGVVYEEVLVAPAPETPISPGEMEISLSLQVAYAIVK
ncbi:26 kDa periplasmic immunogenic protein [subsurface metagenome]